MNAIEVVAAVVLRDGAWLVTRRLEGTHLAGHWEFPGGKIEPGESDDEALRRELLEELGVQAEVGELVLATAHQYPGRHVTLRFYRCSIRGEPRPVLGQEVRWATPAELHALELPEADAGLIALLLGSGLETDPGGVRSQRGSDPGSDP